MQTTTGCKINVAPATGQDFRREIGLVGARGSIEAAKRAIMDKVHAVVSFMPDLFTDRVWGSTLTNHQLVGGEEPSQRWCTA